MKPRVWTVFVAYLFLGILTQMAVTTTGLTCAWWQTGEQHWLVLLNVAAVFEQTPHGFVICRLPAHVVLLLVTMFLGRISPTPIVDRLGMRSHRWSAGQVVTVLGASFLPLLFSITLSAWIVPVDSSVSFYEQFDVESAIIYLGYMTVLPGFVEELFFRGYVQRRLLQRWSPNWSIIITAGLFTAAHGVTPAILLTVFPVALWLGVLAWKTDSIWPGCFCHAMFNAIWCGWPLLEHLTPWPTSLTLPVAGVTAAMSSRFLVIAWPWLSEPHRSSAAEGG
jgi:uncharacterized protein